MLCLIFDIVSGLSSSSFTQADDADVVAACQIHNMELAATKRLPHGREGLRASFAFSLLEAEMDQPLAALGRLQRS